MARSPLPALAKVQVLRRTAPSLANARRLPIRPFHSTQTHFTDGVFKALTEMRVRKPWIEALRDRKKEENNPGSAIVETVEPDVTPKKMADSYVSLVLPLSVSTILAPNMSLFGR